MFVIQIFLFKSDAIIHKVKFLENTDKNSLKCFIFSSIISLYQVKKKNSGVLKNYRKQNIISLN